MSYNQYYYCPTCDQFYNENAIGFSNLKVYLTSTINNCTSYCPGGHIRKISKTDTVFYNEQPIKNIDSTVICFDVVSFSRKKESEQYNIISMIQNTAHEVISRQNKRVIFKGTGDGFIIALLGEPVITALRIVEDMVLNYFIHMNYMKYRIGIDYGTVFSYSAINTEVDIFSKTVINACRISDFGDNCHILISKDANGNLKECNSWIVEYLGSIKDKHKINHVVYNCYKNNVGCQKHPSKYNSR